MNPLFQFTTVKREKCKASILIEGLSGTGKSGLALVLAKALANDDWSKVFAIDTENESLKLFEGLECSTGGTFKDFQVAHFTPDIGFKPTNYEAFKNAALEAGAEVVIQDSVSHAWSYSGGILDMVAALKKTNTRYQKDSYAAWGDDEIVREKQKLYELFRDHRCHIISTVRVKEKMEYDQSEGKTKLVSLGEQQIMQADVKYEPDLVLHTLSPGSTRQGTTRHPVAKVVKSRYAFLEVGETYEFTPQLCNQLKQYLDEGVSPEELLEQQRQDYITEVTNFLDNHQNAIPLWNQLKKDKGYEETKIKDLPLEVLKELYITLTID